MLENVPAAHCVQLTVPPAEANHPAGHAAHAEGLDPFWKRPISHAAQTAAPGADEKVPSAQGAHAAADEAPDTLEDVPAAQGTHAPPAPV